MDYIAIYPLGEKKQPAYNGFRVEFEVFPAFRISLNSSRSKN